jgi:hypothetical protein
MGRARSCGPESGRRGFETWAAPAALLGSDMALGPLMQKGVLDWVCGGATPVRATQRWLALTDSNGTELSAAGFDSNQSSD